MSPWRSLLSSLWHHINGHSYLPDARWVLRRDTPLDEQVLDLWSFRVCRCGSRKFARESGMTWAVTVKGDLSRPVPTSPSPAPASSSSLQVELQKALDNLSRKAIERAARREASPRGTADTDPDARSGTQAVSTQRFDATSSLSSEVGGYVSVRPTPASPSPSSTATAVRTPTSSTSTATPSSDSRPCRAAGSESR